VTLRARVRHAVVFLACSIVVGGFVVLGYVGMATQGRLGAVAAALIANTAMYAYATWATDHDRLTNALFASGYGLFALVGAGLAVSTEAAVPFLVAGFGWYVVDGKRQQEIAETDTGSKDAKSAQSEVSL